MAGGWFPLVHAVSVTLEALFAAGVVVVVYQLCLRWFGRERLDGLMTSAQVVMAIAIAAGAQMAPQLITRFEGGIRLSQDAWWLGLLPPIWFAAFDDALSGHGTSSSWGLAGFGVAATAVVLWAAFGKLAQDYARGLQLLGESRTLAKRKGATRRWFGAMVEAPPMRWWLRDSVTRASFLLTAAYLVRDRDVMLRVYPSVAPLLFMPMLFIFRPGPGGNSFGLAFAGLVLSIVPLTTLSVVRYSQQWQAADVFRTAPMPGPARLCDGARRAVLLVFTVPLIVLFGIVLLLIETPAADFVLLLPGLIPLPVYALVPCLDGNAVPFSLPSEEARNAGRGLRIAGATFASFAVAGLGFWAKYGGWFWWLVLVETVVVAGIYFYMRANVAAARWPPLE